jgi:hypothetical protein
MHAIGHLVFRLLEEYLKSSHGGSATFWWWVCVIAALVAGFFFLICCAILAEQLWHRKRHGRFSDAKEFPKQLVATLVTFVVMCGAIYGVWSIASRPDQQKAIEAIHDLNGTVVQDDTRPDKPVVKVSLHSTQGTNWSQWTKFTDARLKNLMPHLQALPELRELDLSGTEITDEGLKYVKGLPNLKILELGWLLLDDPTPQLSSAAVDDLRRAMPGLEIRYAKAGDFGGIPFSLVRQMRRLRP